MSTQRVGMLLLPGFALTSFALATEALRAANRQAGAELYHCVQLSVDGQPVTSSDGTTVQPHAALEEEPALDLIFVCAYAGASRFSDPATLRWLRQQAKRGIPLGAFSSGSFVLARAGLLDGQPCTIHWEDIAAFREAYPQIPLSERVYALSPRRYTSAGGTAAVDMLLTLIGQQHGAVLAARVADEFVLERPRAADEPQKQHRQLRQRALSPPLDTALALMEGEQETPLSLAEITARAGVSARQLERLFERHLGVAPQIHYRELRLRRARQLLQRSELPVLEVALACGFSSASYFARCYRERYGRTPSEERRTAL